MPKSSKKSRPLRVPSYRHHKPSGKAVVTLGGRDFYLGKYKSAASKAEYTRLIVEWTAGNRALIKQSNDLSLAELLIAFVRHAERYYRGRLDKPSSEVGNFKLAMRPLKMLYGRTRAIDFGPLALKAVRQRMIDDGASRSYANKCTNRIRHIFKWAVENELVPAAVLHGLQALAGIRRGRTEARETEPVKPVPEAFVEAVLPYVSPQVYFKFE